MDAILVREVKEYKGNFKRIMLAEKEILGTGTFQLHTEFPIPAEESGRIMEERIGKKSQ